MNTTIKHIEVVPYNPDWPKMFETESQQIKELLGDHVISIHHIGSTSVEGLSAKEELDILCIVDELKASLKLQDIGYIFKRELNIPLRYGFSRNTNYPKINLHVVEQDHGFISLNLCFREYLRSNESIRLAYMKLKETLLLDPKNFEQKRGIFTGYNLGKNEFIKSILEQAGWSDYIVNFCMHDSEWDTYHRIRKEQIFNPIGVAYDRNHPTLTQDNHYHFVLYKGTKIVTVAHVELLNETEAALRSLATDVPYKKQGYGAHMMTFLEKWVQYQERTVLKMHAAMRAETFYRKLGYMDMPFDDPSIAKDIVDLGKIL